MTTITETIFANAELMGKLEAKGAKVRLTPARVNNRGRQMAARYIVNLDFATICGEVTNGTFGDLNVNLQSCVIDFRDNGKDEATLRISRLEDERGDEYERVIRDLIAC